MIRQIIFDTETTGLTPPDHRIIEFAGLEMINRKATGKRLHLYIHPERDIPHDSFKIHGISLERLADEPKFYEVAEQIADFIRGAELIAHNAPFDMKFLDSEFARLNMPTASELVDSVTDTLKLAKTMRPGSRNTLDALCDAYGVDRKRRTAHGAMIDSELLAEVYLALTRGQDDFLSEFESDLNEISLPSEKLNALNLKVLFADEAEQAQHQNYLDLLDKKAGAPCLWRQFGEKP